VGGASEGGENGSRVSPGGKPELCKGWGGGWGGGGGWGLWWGGGGWLREEGYVVKNFALGFPTLFTRL